MTFDVPTPPGGEEAAPRLETTQANEFRLPGLLAEPPAAATEGR